MYILWMNACKIRIIKLCIQRMQIKAFWPQGPLLQFKKYKKCCSLHFQLFMSFLYTSVISTSFINVLFMSYSKSSNWRQKFKILSNFGCLFTFCFLDGASSIKTDLHIQGVPAISTQFRSQFLTFLIFLWKKTRFAILTQMV